MKHSLDKLISIALILTAFSSISRVSAQVTIEQRRLLGTEITEIIITGNDVTQAKIILHEMKLKPGMLVSEALLTEDMLRVMGLDLFNRVEFRLRQDQGKTVLEIEVTEEWYIFPMPFWDISSDDPPELTYGFRYNQKNFRGRAERFKASLWGGAKRGFKFKHVTPWIEGTPNFSQTIEIYQVTVVSQNLAVKDLELEARHTGVSYQLGKRWNLELGTGLSGRFRLVTAGNSAQLASAGEVDRILDIQLINIWDRRDLKQFPRRGSYLRSGLTHGWVLNLEKSYTRAEIDARGYLPVAKSVSFCARSVWYPAWGEAPPYDWFQVKNTTPIRSADTSDEGKSLVLGSIEARIDLLTLHYFTWEKAPLLKSYFRNLAYGLALEFFADVGDAYNSFDELTAESLMWGYGFGFLVRLPYIDVLRLETSWNPEISPQNFSLSWKIGVSF